MLIVLSEQDVDTRVRRDVFESAIRMKQDARDHVGSDGLIDLRFG